MATTTNYSIAKPIPLPVRAENIPAEMKAKNQWVVWKYTWKEKQQKWDKPPYNARTGRLAKSTEADTWSAWEVAWTAYEEGGWDGVGYVFSGEADDFFGCDLDKCRDPESGIFRPWTQVQRQRWHADAPEVGQILGLLNTYGEVSPSAAGCKLIGKGQPARTGKRGDFELYIIDRYFTVTGHRHPDCPESINVVDAEVLAKVNGWFWPERTKSSTTSTHSTGAADPTRDTPTADTIIAKLRGSRSGGKFSRLFDSGDKAGYPSASEADAALCFMAAFYSARSANLIDQVYRKSALMRDKWDEKHYTDGTTYGQATVALALDKCSKFYDWTAKRKAEGKQESEAEASTSTGCGQSLPAVVLPGDAIPITQTADILGAKLGETGEFFLRGGVPMRAAQEEDEVKLEVLRPAAACSDFERVARLFRTKNTPQGTMIVPTICTEQRAKLIIEASAFKSRLPVIKVLSRCPVLTEIDGQLTVITGYSRRTGIWARGETPTQTSLAEAKKHIDELVADFQFASEGDRSRAIAAFITPALLFGGLLGDRAPIDLGEADDSQSGKGYRNKLTTALYRSSPKAVTQRDRGVGGLQEAFDLALITAAPFISLDNLRGKFECAAIESFMTEASYFARIPYAAPVEIDPSRIAVLATTNSAELNRDIANRSSIVRILKHQGDYQFRSYPGKVDLLYHVRAHQPLFLGAVFSVIGEWHRRGKPSLPTPNHDFRRWAGVLGWIIEELLGLAPLMTGHREVQTRAATPELQWLRSLVLAIKETNQIGRWLRVNKVLDTLVNRNIETPGINLKADLADSAAFKKVAVALGRKLGNLFPKEGEQCVKVENFTLNRRKGTDSEGREKSEYAVFLQSPNGPQSAPNGSPNENPQTPNAPNQCATFHSADRTSESEGGDKNNKSYAGIGGIGGSDGALGEMPAVAACDHLEPAAWVRKGNQAHCPGCDRFMGMVGRVAKEAVQ